MKPFAIYFPQYYPTPVNDDAWGKGFTDWSLVANANMRDWWNRRAPARGFYDGASSDVHRSQIDEALRAGVGGFGVYHYWFYPRHELNAFERTLLDRSTPSSMPWFLIWASEGWSRRWMGDPSVLIHLSPNPSRADIQRHCEYLAHCFDDPRYFRIRGRPLFAWYNLGHFTRPEDVVAQYRECWGSSGHDVHTAQFVKKPFDVAQGRLVDSSYLFEPRLYFASQSSGTRLKGALDALKKTLGEALVAQLLVWADRLAPRAKTYPAADFLRYLASEQRQALIDSLPGTVQDVLSPGWNNTPRYGDKFTALEALSAEAFARLVVEARADTDLPLLINAWNEWSEGAAIEPCAYLGSRYLAALGSPSADRTEVAVAQA